MNRIGIWLVSTALFLAASHTVKAETYNAESFTLANGLTGVVIQDHRAPVLTHMLWYRVGGADDPPGKSGLAHFLEHLMFRGTKSVPPGEYTRIIARNGGRTNAFTSSDYTGYYQDVARDKLELVMRLEADRMVNLRLSDAVVLPERQVIIEERHQRIDNSPRALLDEQATAAQFLAHPYGTPAIGWEQEMRQLSSQDALNFYHAHYAPNNAILIVAGDVTLPEVKALAERTYGKVPKRNIAPRLRRQEPPQIAARRLVLEDTRVREAAWSRTYLAPSRSAGDKQHAYPLILFAEIFGSGTTSRLYRDLVLNNGPASSAGAWYDSNSLDPAQFGFSATPKAGVDVATLEAAVERSLEKFLQDGPDPAELSRAKAGLEASAIYARDSASGIARTIGIGLVTGLSLQDIQAWPERIAAVTAADIRAAGQAIFDPRRSVTSVLLPKKAGNS